MLAVEHHLYPLALNGAGRKSWRAVDYRGRRVDGFDGTVIELPVLGNVPPTRSRTMITLYAFGPQFGLPDPSPFVTKADVLLKMGCCP